MKVRGSRKLLAATTERKRAAELEEAYEKLREAQEMLLSQEKLVSLGQLAAGVAHEIRNRLSVISTCHDNISAFLNLKEHPKLSKMSEHITQAVASGAEILNELMACARPGEPEHVPCTVRELVEEVLPLVSREMELQDIQLDIHLSGASPAIVVDKGQVQQVLFNLLLNAQQAVEGIPSGERQRVIRLAEHTSRNEVSIEIWDNGPGIEAVNLSRVFDPFFTRKEAGFGNSLGLSVSSGIIKRHGGSIDVKSDPLEGTSFTIRLPAVAVKEASHGI